MSHLWIQRVENGQEERKQREQDQEDQSISYATSRRLYLLPSSLLQDVKVKWSEVVLLLMEDITETKVRVEEKLNRKRERRDTCENMSGEVDRCWSDNGLFGLFSLKICFHWIYFFFCSMFLSRAYSTSDLQLLPLG